MEVRKLPLINRPGEFALVDGDYDGELFAQFGWVVQGKHGHVMTSSRVGGKKNQPRYLSRMAYGESLIPEGWWVINKNRDLLDCRTANLVALPPKKVIRQYRPQGKQRTFPNRVGYRGVRLFTPNGSQYIASIKNLYIRNADGTIRKFDTPEEAARAYDVYADAYYGDRAVLNFPKEKL